LLIIIYLMSRAVKVDSAFGSIMYSSHAILRCGTIGEKA
jgi:hypothetical protein